MTRIFDGFASVWLVFWLSFIAVYIHFGGMAFAGLSILLGIVGWALWLINPGIGPLRSRDVIVPMAAFALFFAWLTLSATWGVAGLGTGYRLAGQMAMTAAIPALLLSRSTWRLTVLAQVIMAVALAGVAIMLLDLISGYGLNTFFDPVGTDGDLNRRQGVAEMDIGRGQVVYALMTPLLLGLFATRLPRKSALLAATAFIGLLLFSTTLNRLSIAPIIMLMSAPLIYIGYKSPRWGLRISLGTFAASILFAPLVGVVSRLAGEGLMAHLPMSWDHRLRMWDYSLSQISDAPWIGQGLDRSRTFQEEFTTRIGVDVPFISLHPHNIGLQTWMEAGFIGAALLTLAIVSLYTPLRRLTGQHAWRGAAVSGVVMGAAVASAVTIGAWQYWWWGLIGLTLSLIVLIPNELILSSRDIAE